MNVFIRLVAQGIGDLFRSPWSVGMTTAAITLISFLGAAFLMFVHNLDLQIAVRQGNVQFQIYWDMDAEAAQAKKDWETLSSFERVVRVQTFTPDEALDRLGESFPKTVDLKWMKGRSPLPYTALVECVLPKVEGKKWATDMVERLKALPGVDKVSFNPLQVDILTSWVGFTRIAFWPVSGFLLITIALVVGNTIKLALLARREELEILRFVGASRAYIQTPLLVGGAFQGFVGAILALGLLKFAHYGVVDIFNVPPLWITIAYLPQAYSLTLILVLTGIGMFSSLVALRN